MNRFEVTVSVSEVEGLARRIERLPGDVLGRAAVDAVNAVVTRFDELQRKGQVADIALSPAYVKSKTDLQLAANPANPRALLTTRGDLTILGRYNPTVLRDPERLDRAGRRMGNRQAGVRVAIKPSAPVEETQWFTMRLKNGNGTGVFVRTSAGRVKHIYGPSPYSLFRHQINTRSEDLREDLQRTGLAAMADAVERETS